MLDYGETSWFHEASPALRPSAALGQTFGMRQRVFPAPLQAFQHHAANCQKLLLWLSLCMAAVSLAGTPAAARGFAKPADFPIFAWYGPRMEAPALRQYGAAFFNAAAVRGTGLAADMLPAVHEAGMGAVLEPAGERGFDELAERVRNGESDAPFAILLDGEVEPAGLPSTLAELSRLRAQLPETRVLAIAAPTLPPEARAITARALAQAGSPVVYPAPLCRADGTNDWAAFLDGVQQARQIADETGAPLWGYAQYSQYDGFRRAAESDLRVQVYTWLAHGAKGMTYFSYRTPRPHAIGPGLQYERFDEAIIEGSTPSVGYGYEIVRPLNIELHFLSRKLTGFTLRGVWFTGDVPPGGALLRRAAPCPVTHINGPDTIVASFEDASAEHWVLVVNRRHGAMRSALTQAATFRIHLEDGYGHAIVYDRHTAFEKPVPLENGSFVVTIPGGTGMLFKAASQDAPLPLAGLLELEESAGEMAAPSATEQPLPETGTRQPDAHSAE